MNTSSTSSTKMQRQRSIGSASGNIFERAGNENGQLRIIEHDDKSQLIVASALKEAPANCDDACEGFCLQNAFALRVPGNYDHATQLDSLRRNHSIESINFGFNGGDQVGFGNFSDDITDKHFANVTHKLMPGKTYLGKIFMFHFFKNADKAPLNNDCLSFLKSQNAILCGAQGLSLAWQCAREEFPPGYLFSMDEKNALWHNGEHIMVPAVRHFPQNCWTFGLMRYGSGEKFRDIRVLCVCEMP